MSRAQLANAQRLYEARSYADAERACRDALKAKPGDMQATRLLGQIIRHTGKASESVQIFNQLGQARPNDVQLVGEMGASLVAANMHPQALPALRKAVDAMPKAVKWRVWLGRCLTGLFQTPAAIRVLEEAQAMAPDDPDVSFHLANALLNASRNAHAEPHARAFLEHHPDSVPARAMLAKILEHQSRLDEALEILRGLLGDTPGDTADPNLDQALACLVRCLNAQGKADEALAACERTAARSPTPTLVIALAPVYLKHNRHQELLDLIEAVLAAGPMPEPVRAGLLFYRGDALRGLGEHDRAFESYIEANNCYPDTFDRAQRTRVYDALRETFVAEQIKSAPRATIDASRCVFIVGMPRSGTSLVEQIIDAHPQAHGAGELNDLPNLVDTLARKVGVPPPMCFAQATTELLDEGARLYTEPLFALAPDAKVITDKLPHNFELLGLINRMLPGAKVIHCTRNPIDNCVSAFTTPLGAWHSYSNNLANLGWAYGQYAALMDHYRQACDLQLLEIPYEDIVADVETHARRIIEFVGLPWDDRCLRFYETDRAVTTASVDQVRRPIYSTSVARWKRYEQHLGPLIDALRESGVQLPAD